MNIGIIFLVFCFIIIVIIALFGLVKKLKLNPISDWCNHYASFYNDAGVFLDTKKIKFKEAFFEYGGRFFNFKPQEASCLRVGAMFRNKKYYFYNINNPDPILIDKKCEPIMDSKVYQAVHENDLVIQLNALANQGFWEWFKKYWWVVIIGAIIVIYFASGHTFLTGKAVNVVNTTTTTLVKNTTGVYTR